MIGNAVRLASGMALAPLEAAVSVSTGLTQYSAGAVRKGKKPLDVLIDVAEWWRVVTIRERPPWTHPHTEIKEWPLARLLDYSSDDASDMIPTIVLPPQAGHDSSIVDYAAGQSQMLALREAGLDKLYCLAWSAATAETANATADDYIELLRDAVEIVGGKVNLVGDCQGGWFAVLYAALYPEQVNTLTIAGAPINFHAGRSVIKAWMEVLGGPTDTKFYEALVTLGGGVHKGDNQVLGFKMLEPAAELDRLMQLFAHIDDDQFKARHITFTNWFEWTQDVPGAFYLWIVKNLFAQNSMIKGELEIGGRKVDLAKIECPIVLIAGTADHITPAEQVWALADYVSTPPEKITRDLVNSGHLGLFMGTDSLHNHWKPLMAGVAKLSQPSS